MNQRFKGRGVRVLQVIIQNPDRTTGTPEFCRAWKSRYGLTNRMLVDPAGSVRRYASGDLPGAFIFDRNGRVRFVGRAASLSTIRYNIEAILDGVAGP